MTESDTLRVVAADVKTSPAHVRRWRSREARAAVVGEARRLFLEQGYASTALSSVGEAAGVPAATLYRLFGSKIGVLKAVLDVAAGGDDQPVAFGDRPGVATKLQMEDPVEQLSAFAQIAGDVMRRVAPIHQMLVGAAASDPEATQLLVDFTAQRRRGQARIARSLAGRGKLADGLTERRAADIIFALMSPEVYQLLTVQCAWTTKQYRLWLARSLVTQLLA